MKSRAHMLLEKEYVKLRKEPLWGIHAKPLNDHDFFVWEAKIEGLKDTMWEGGTFKIYLKFNEMYNSGPPEIVFATIPFHPNVDITTGKPCVDYLDNLEDWKQSYDVGYILLSLQTLLSNPVIQNAVNADAASVYMDRPEMYRKMVLDCVLASKRLDAGLSPHFSDKRAVPLGRFTDESHQKSNTCLQHAKKVSFEDYLLLWKGIATSNPSGITPNPFKELLKKDDKLQNAHFGLSQDELKQEIRLQLAEHNKVMYGNFNWNDEYSSTDIKSSKIQVLKQVSSSKPNEATTRIRLPLRMSDSMDFDKEVDELVDWTRGLSSEQINF